MRKLKHIYLAMAVMPLLFSGCLQEKVSKVAPPKLADKNVSFNQKTTEEKTIEETLFASSTPPSNEQNQSHTDLNNLDSLMQLVENNIDMEVKGKEGSYTKAVEVGEDWVELTKEDEIVSTATSFLGTEYVWAANGPSAFDCSGFTKYVYKKNGMTLPRYSGHQAHVGIKVSYDELEKGDLVFFDTEKKFHHKVNHVGIYMGDGRFIHASSAKKRVIITNFNQKTFYKRRFLWGQRIVNSNSNYASL